MELTNFRSDSMLWLQSAECGRKPPATTRQPQLARPTQAIDFEKHLRPTEVLQAMRQLLQATLRISSHRVNNPLNNGRVR